MPCEDYPCCGHAPGDCPTIDSKGRERWKCARCGKRLRLNSPSSLCNACLRRVEQIEYEERQGYFWGGY